MLKMKVKRKISGFFSKASGLLLVFLTMGSAKALAQDTLRTYGPRIGMDLSRAVFYFTEPRQTGVEASVDFELIRHLYPVFELGYNRLSEQAEGFAYSTGGVYVRAGADYDFLSPDDRSKHHCICAGLRYGFAAFSQKAKDISINSSYWGPYTPEDYQAQLEGHWLELVASMKTEIFSNFFLGWSLRLKLLLNPEMDPRVRPLMIAGYGSGRENRVFGFSYGLYYKIPLLKR